MIPHLVPPLFEAPVTDWIRHHLMRAAGITAESLGDDDPAGSAVTLEELDTAAAMKRDPHFDDLRMARLRMGHLRYGSCGSSGDASYDVIASCIKRLQEYRTTGNREHLVDVANLVEIEWVWPRQAGTYWEAQDTGGHWSLRYSER